MPPNASALGLSDRSSRLHRRRPTFHRPVSADAGSPQCRNERVSLLVFDVFASMEAGAFVDQMEDRVLHDEEAVCLDSFVEVVWQRRSGLGGVSGL